MIDMKKALQDIDDVIEKGPYKDTWASLSSWQTPKWYQKAKFGIFIHWGVYSVPAFDSEWYPRNMYIEGSKVYEHHIKTYGAHKDFGYKDFIATVYKGNIIKNLIMDCQSYTKYRPNETTGGIFVSWRRKEELPTGA